jgi:hypothetical protein
MKYCFWISYLALYILLQEQNLKMGQIHQNNSKLSNIHLTSPEAAGFSNRLSNLLKVTSLVCCRQEPASNWVLPHSSKLCEQYRVVSMNIRRKWYRDCFMNESNSLHNRKTDFVFSEIKCFYICRMTSYIIFFNIYFKY